jgi:hypothetical protein
MLLSNFCCRKVKLRCIWLLMEGSWKCVRSYCISKRTPRRLTMYVLKCRYCWITTLGIPLYLLFYEFQKGRTPLHYAAQKDHSDVIEFFLENRPQLVNQANAVCDVIIAKYSMNRLCSCFEKVVGLICMCCVLGG